MYVKVSIFALLLVCLLTSAACASKPPDAPQGAATPPVVTQTQPSTTVGANPQPSMPVPATTQDPTTQKENQPVGPDPTQSSKAKPLMSPGPDNSEIETTLAENLTQVRIFKGNKYVSKIVLVTITKSNAKTLTLYDKAGAAHKLPESAAATAMTDSGENLARAAGITVATPAPAETKEQQRKRESGQTPGKQGVNVTTDPNTGAGSVVNKNEEAARTVNDRSQLRSRRPSGRQ